MHGPVRRRGFRRRGDMGKDRVDRHNPRGGLMAEATRGKTGWREGQMGELLSEFLGTARPHHVRYRRGGDVRRRPAPVRPRRRDDQQRRLAAHHLRVGHGGHHGHLRRRRDQRRAHQPRRHDRAGRSGAAFPWTKVPGYIVAQVLGAFVGAAIVYLNYKDAIIAAEDAAGSRQQGREHGRDLRHRTRGVLRQLLGPGDQRDHGHDAAPHHRVRGDRPDEHPAEGQPRRDRHRLRRDGDRHVLRRQLRLRDQPGPRLRAASVRRRRRLGRGGLPRRHRRHARRLLVGARSSRRSSAP